MSNLLHLEKVDSTNTYLKIRQGSLPHGTVVYADRQTAGRGRYTRSWISDEGGLYFSVLLKTPLNSFSANLTQLMALSICQSLEKLGLSPVIKWPNDVQVNGQKISGILSEAVLEKNLLQAIVLGVGINVNQNGLKEIDQPATSLRLLGIEINRNILLEDVLRYFWQGYPDLCEKGFESIRKDYTQRFAALGKQVSVHDGEKTISGRVQGVSPRGALLLQTAQGLQEIYIGDLQA